MYPLVSELAAEGIPVVVACRVLKLAHQPYYRWLGPVTDRELADAYLANAVFDAHHDDPEFGYRLLADEVCQAGHTRCDRTVWRICAANRWWSVFGKKRAKNGKRPGPPAHDDLVERRFSADRPNQLWLTDITEHWTDEGKVCRPVVFTAHSAESAYLRERICAYVLNEGAIPINPWMVGGYFPEWAHRSLPGHPVFAPPPLWDSQYSRVARPVRACEGMTTFPTAVAFVTAFLAPALDGSAAGQRWSAATGAWQA